MKDHCSSLPILRTGLFARNGGEKAGINCRHITTRAYARPGHSYKSQHNATLQDVCCNCLIRPFKKQSDSGSRGSEKYTSQADKPDTSARIPITILLPFPDIDSLQSIELLCNMPWPNMPPTPPTTPPRPPPPSPASRSIPATSRSTYPDLDRDARGCRESSYEGLPM